MTWTVEWPDIPVKGTATHAFRAMCVERCLKRDLKSVSDEIGVAYTTLERWFYEDAPKQLPNAANCEAPKVVCLDEFAVQKGHKYGLNLMDEQTGHIWVVGSGRSRQDIQNALELWP
jgi:transposase